MAFCICVLISSPTINLQHEIDSEMGGDGFGVKSRYNLPQLLL